MAEMKKRRGGRPPKPKDTPMQKRSFTLPTRLSSLLAFESQDRGVTESKLLADILAARFDGYAIHRPSKDGKTGAVDPDPRAKIAG